MDFKIDRRRRDGIDAVFMEHARWMVELTAIVIAIEKRIVEIVMTPAPITEAEEKELVALENKLTTIARVHTLVIGATATNEQLNLAYYRLLAGEVTHERKIPDLDGGEVLKDPYAKFHITKEQHK